MLMKSHPYSVLIPAYLTAGVRWLSIANGSRRRGSYQVLTEIFRSGRETDKVTEAGGVIWNLGNHNIPEMAAFLGLIPASNRDLDGN